MRGRARIKDIKDNFPSETELRRETIEQHIIDINNKLHSLCSFMQLDLEDIKHIPREKEVRDRVKTLAKEEEVMQIKESIDEEKRAVVAAIVADERIEKMEEIREAVMKSTGITSEEFKRFSQEEKIKKMLDEKNRKINIDSKKTKGLAPPKTDWKRLGLDKGEKDKIIDSIKANPKSNVFSKDFKWNPEDFLTAFKYLENSKEYNGPFIATVVTDKAELERYSNIEKISAGVHDIYLGKYVLLSLYDITASEESSEEAKHMYIGMEFLDLAGRLKFKSLGSIGGDIKDSQRQRVVEFLEAMDVIYYVEHIDLKINL